MNALTRSMLHRLTTAAWMACAATATNVAAEATVRLIPAEAELVMSGKSTLHRWSCRSDQLDGEMVFEGDKADWLDLLNTIRRDDPAAENSPPAPRVVAAFRPESLACANPRMRRDLLDAVRIENHPEVHYEVTGLESPLRPCESDPEVQRASIRGRLSLAGKTRELAHEARIRFRDDFAIEVEGEIHLNMLDFNIDPPVAMLGLLRAHEDVSIAYRLVTRLAPDATEAAVARLVFENSE